MSVSDRITTAGLQQTDGGSQQMTQAGLTAWIDAVNAFRAANAGKKRLFAADHDALVRTSRRSTT